MEAHLTLLCLAVATVFVAFANGANDNFKGVATLHGSGTFSYRAALAWATVSTLVGSLSAALLSCGLVARFSGRGLVADAVAADPAFLVAVASATAATVLLATRFGFPVSTTHALTGGLLGAAAVLTGPSRIAYGALASSFLVPLLMSPVLALLLAAALYALLHRARMRLGGAQENCVCVGSVAPVAALVTGRAAATLTSGLTVTVDSVEHCERHDAATVLGLRLEPLLDRLHVLSAGAVGFARGLNDTPKIVALLVGAGAMGVRASSALVAVAIAAGGLLAARRVARTLSFDITEMNHGQGLAANLVTAALVTLASPFGLPVSTTHVSCGALFGIGAANGRAQLSTILKILSAWVTTLPVAACLAALLALAAPSFVK